MKRQTLFLGLLVALLASCGKTFTAPTKEGVELTYHITDGTEKVCEVGSGSSQQAAVKDASYRGPLTIPSSADGYYVDAIGEGAFQGFAGMTSVNIPASVITLGDYAFEACDGLREVVVHSRVQAFGEGVFASCHNLRKVKFRCPLTRVADHLFDGCKLLETFSIPEGVTAIGDYAFKDCAALHGLELPQGVENIGIEAFMGCSSLDEVVLPEGLRTIGDGAFQGCHNLRSIHIPASVTSIGEAAFYNCPSLTSITVDPKNPVYDSRKGCNAIVEKKTNLLLQACSKTRIPPTVTDIADGAFAFCPGIERISLPPGVTSIGSFAFAYCPDLRSVTFPSSLTAIGDRPFAGCPQLSSIDINSENPVFDSHNQCDAVVETLTNTLLYGCRNTTIPSVVTKIGPNAFSACPGLTTIRLHEGMKSIGERAFAECPNLKEVTLPSTLASIGVMAFKDCKALALLKVRMRQPLTIDENVFSGCNTVRLVVPKGKREDYLAAKGWMNFQIIEDK